MAQECNLVLEEMAFGAFLASARAQGIDQKLPVNSGGAPPQSGRRLSRRPGR